MRRAFMGVSTPGAIHRSASGDRRQLPLSEFFPRRVPALRRAPSDGMNARLHLRAVASRSAFNAPRRPIPLSRHRSAGSFAKQSTTTMSCRLIERRECAATLSSSFVRPGREGRGSVTLGRGWPIISQISVYCRPTLAATRTVYLFDALEAYRARTTRWRELSQFH